MPLRWFVHVDSPVAWKVADPVAWCLAHRHNPLLRAAQPELDHAVMLDDSGVVDLVLRYCSLNLVTFDAGLLAVSHWGANSRADLRLFARHELPLGAVKRIEVRDVESGDVSDAGLVTLFQGIPMPEPWPVGAFKWKFQQRRVEEADDGTVVHVPGSDLVEPIDSQGPWSWAAFKDHWRSNRPLSCPDCERPAILVHLGCKKAPGGGWRPRLVFACLACRRLHIHDPQQRMWVNPATDSCRPPFRNKHDMG